jgi:predicted RND superfamily exporter protein
MLNKTVNFIIKKRFWVILLIALLTLFFGFQIKNLKIVIDPNTMLPQSHPNVIGTNYAESLFGSKHVVVVGISAKDGGSVLRPEIMKSVASLSAKIADISGVKRHTLMSISADKAKAISGNESEMRVAPMLSYPITEQSMEELHSHIVNNPMYQGSLISKDHRVTAISFAIKSGQGGFREVMDKVQKVLELEDKPNIVIHSSGAPVFFAAVERFAQRMAVLFPIALILIGLIHFEAFRTIQGLILPLITALLAVIWGLGIMGAANVPMDAFNATTPILILAVAAGHAVQILKRYYEEYDRTTLENPNDESQIANDKAIINSLNKVAPVMLTAGCVAALGFFSLLTFDIATIRTFGLFTGIGILSALLIELTFIPALRSYLPAPPLQQTRKNQEIPRVWDRFSNALANTVLARRHRILLTFLAITAISSTGLFFINQENSTKSYFGESLQVRTEDHYLNQHLAGTNTLYIVFKGQNADQMKDPGILKLIEETQRYAESLPEVGKTVSIVDLIKQMHRSMNGGNSQFHALPTSQDMISQYLLLYSMSGQPTDFDAYIDYEYRNANLIVWMKNDSSKYAASIISQLKQHLANRVPSGVEIFIGGSVPQSSALSETLVHGKILNIAQMIFVVFLAGVVIFRSLLAGVYLIVPLLVTVLVNFGVMGVSGIPLNTPNSVASAMAIGIGADYAIYILYRMREELNRLGDLDLALRETLRTAGKAVVYVATAIAGGYSVLMLSFNFYVHIWFGILIVLSMIVSALSSLILVPALLKAFPPAFLKKPMKSFNPQQRTSTTNSAKATTLLSISTCILLFSFFTQSLSAQEIKSDEIMERNYQSTRLDSSISEASFRLISASGQERLRKTLSVSKLNADGINNRRMIRFLSPSDVRNTTTLLDENSEAEDAIWIYLPALKKSRRLASSNKKNSFVGTELSYGDIIGHKTQQWSHKLLRQENQNNTPTYLIESVPKSAAIAQESGYSKRISWIHKEHFFAIKIDFYDTAGVLLKTVNNSDLKEVDTKHKKWQAMLVSVKNHQTGGSTIIKLDKFDANGKVNDDFFSLRYLEKEQ